VTVDDGPAGGGHARRLPRPSSVRVAPLVVEDLDQRPEVLRDTDLLGILVVAAPETDDGALSPEIRHRGLGHHDTGPASVPHTLALQEPDIHGSSLGRTPAALGSTLG
jgi:hypothetical protein